MLSLAKRLTVGQINSMIGKYDFERSGPPGASPSEPVGAATAGDEVSVDVQCAAVGSPNPSADADLTASPVPAVPADRSWFGVGDDGRWRLHLETSPDVGMTIAAAIRERRDHAFQETGEMISDAEALAGACQRSLDTLGTPARRERFRTNVHLDTDGRATDELGRNLPDAIRAHITCDGLLTPIFHENAEPISVGRTQRIVPERTRKIVLLRDGGCRIPGCGATDHLEIHHIIHWSNGGPTDTWNLVALCGHHHRMHHHGRIDISGNADRPDGLRITNVHGIDLADAGARPDPPTESPPDGNYQPPLGERLDMDWVSFIHPRRLEDIAEQARRHADRHRLDRQRLEQHQTRRW